MVDYSDRLQQAMTDAKVSKTALADELGISYQAVRKVLEGGRFNAKNNAKAAKFLKVSSDWLATGVGQKSLAAKDDQPEFVGPPAPPGKEFGAVTPKEQAMLDELLLYFRDLLPSDRTAKLAELRALAKVRAAERQEMWEEAGLPQIMEKAANATRRQTETATSTPRHRPPVIDPNAPELPHIPPPPDEGQ